MKRLVCAAASLLVLSGCMEMKQELQVSADGTARFNVELAVDAAVLAMQARNGAESNFCKNSGNTAEGMEVRYEQRTERGDVVCSITATASLDRFARAMEDNALLPSAGADGGDVSPQMALVKDGENYRLEVAMAWPAQEPPKDGAPDMSQMLVAMVAGRSMSWSVTAPVIVETTGTLSEDGKTASYSVPLASLVSGQVPEARFSATFGLGSRGMFDWIGGLFGG